MSYPQFVEVLSLLATSAADRLRLLYPDVTGPDPSLAVEGSRTDEKLTDSSADTGTSRGGRLLSESKSAEVEHGGVGRGGKTKSRNNAGGQLIHRKEIDVRVSMRLKSGRYGEKCGGDETLLSRRREGDADEYGALDTLCCK